jgi:hypothetical protein
MEYGIFGILTATFAIILVALWVLLPFALFGVKPLLRDRLNELREANGKRVEIDRNGYKVKP